MTGRILLASINLLSLFLALRRAHGQQSSAPTSGPTVAYDLTLAPTAAETNKPRATPGPTSRSTVAPTRETPAPTLSSNASAPARETPAPTLSSNASAPAQETPAPTLSSNTSTSPTEEPEVVQAPPTEQPTVVQTSPPTVAPTLVPTAAPTASPTAPCERPYTWSNESDVPCVDMVTAVDKASGAGAFYDEEGCGPEAESTSVVGCAHGGVGNCRLCVFNRGLFSETILGGEEVPFVDCPCCVPDTYEMGGDIECEFAYSSPPVSAPTPMSVEGSVSTPAPAPGEWDTNSTLAPTIPMEPCETRAGGNSSALLCVDIASAVDWENGIGTYYESGCQGVGCDIAGHDDCRQCVFDSEAYATSGGNLKLAACPCCVPITYKLRPEGSECVWPPTPSPTAAPTTAEELLERNVAARPGMAFGGSLVVIAAVVGGLVGLG
ncbi:unnamed protein product [Ectocarpus sp. 12 AP-2014]